ncbi:MAG: hypothetical protein GF383_05625 [Candidatus Lokiarchaeota archaeon]|nr:hypothetical protein [Candidatus Lokiarchaeota archaeon]MBD3339410.1 hypothetical protein [Candidatus Lokiarchaeota archaeon]
MVDSHSQSFFGQSSAIIIQSSSKSDPYVFIRCLKKKPDNSWEKPSEGEGKVIKCSLEEMVMILRVLERQSEKWSSYHSYKEKKTPISINWADNNAETLWINIGKYKKMLGLAQAEVLRLLLNHLLKEKIKYATVSNYKTADDDKAVKMDREVLTEKEPSKNHKYYYEVLDEPSNQNELPEEYNPSDIATNYKKTKNNLNNNVSIQATIKVETEKALLISLSNGKEAWIPKSTIESAFQSGIENPQPLVIKDWVLKKNDLIA